jgi:hypothetical protein
MACFRPAGLFLGHSFGSFLGDHFGAIWSPFGSQNGAQMSSFSVLLASKIEDNFPMSSWGSKVAPEGLPRGLLVPLAASGPRRRPRRPQEAQGDPKSNQGPPEFLQGSPSSPKDAPRTHQEALGIPQAPPRTSQGPPKDTFSREQCETLKHRCA